MIISPFAGKLPSAEQLVNVAKLVTAYYTNIPDPSNPLERVAFGTSGHRGSSFETSFNDAHVLAISQAICLYRARQGIDGPLFIGIDTHALSEPAFASALEVLAANGVEVMMAAAGEYTPTPAVSHAILCYNLGRTNGLADGIVITPSHNPPDSGGFKYNPPNGGPADGHITGWIEDKANELLAAKLKDVKRMSYEKALSAPTTHEHDFLNSYVNDLVNVVDLDLIRSKGVRMGVDPMGGAGVHYWSAIADRYRLDLDVINPNVDPTFRSMSLDWDGQIRMDPSSAYAMQPLIDKKANYEIAFACDTDHDRHGIVTQEGGLMPANHYLAVAIDYLFRHRPDWPAHAGVGKTLVSSQMIDRVTAKLKRKLIEMPVGFKWFADGLFDGSLGFAGEESAGATFLRRDGRVWTTDKDGITAGLLSAEILAGTERDPQHNYKVLTQELGEPSADRVQATVTPEQKKLLKSLSSEQVKSDTLAGEKIKLVLSRAPGNDAAIGGIKVETQNGWFAARPSGTEDIYKIYAESFRGDEHLKLILEDAESIVSAALGDEPGSES
jgi:phosphoglucomutase